MKHIDKTVLRETAYIATWVLIFSAILQSVFLILTRWDLTVLLGNLLSGVTVILNFFLMAISVSRAVQMEEKDAAAHLRLSRSLRTLFMFVIAVVGVSLPAVFNLWSVLIPFLFPRAAIALMPVLRRKDQQKEDSADEE